MFEDLNYEELKRRANARLPDRVVAALEARGERRSVAVGEMLYKVDDCQYPFVYAVSATLEVRDPDAMVLGVLEPGQFTGEMGLLLGQTAFADCIAVESGEVLLVAPLQIADLVQVDPEVSDILLPAFAARRLQTSLPGVFAVADVRSGSVKRVASAVGEGSVVVRAIHARLAALRQGEARKSG